MNQIYLFLHVLHELHIWTGVSCPSVSSDVSCDYADPPDETSDKSDLESLEPEKKLLRYATDNHKLVMSRHPAQHYQL